MNDFEKIHTEIVPEKQFIQHYAGCQRQRASGRLRGLFPQRCQDTCIDHHRNPIQDLQEQNYIIPDASSCSEVLYTLRCAKIAEWGGRAFYTGIVHDMVVYLSTPTTRKTMEIAGALMERRERGEDHRRQLLPQDLRTEPDSRNSAGLAVHGFWMEDVFSVWFQKRNGVLQCRYERSGWYYRSARITEGGNAIFIWHEKAFNEYKVSFVPT